MRSRVKILLICLFILSVLFSTSCVIINRTTVVPTPTSSTQPIISVILTVNNEDVSTDYFLKRVVANPNGDVSSTFQLLEVELIIKQRAAANGVLPVTDLAIDDYLRGQAASELATNSATAPANTTPISDALFNKWMNEQLANTGLSLTEYREVIGREIQSQRLTDILSANIPTSMAQVHLWAIPFNSQSAALAAKAKIDSGTEFATVANTIAGLTNGGDQGWLPLAVLPSALNTAASSLAVGVCSDPVAYTQSSTSSSGSTSYVLLLISEKSDSMPVTPSQLAVLKNNTLNNWLNQQLTDTTITLHNLNGTTVNGLTGTVDDATLTWLNDQAQKLSSKRPSSTETSTTPNIPANTVLTLTPVANWSGSGPNTTQPFTIAHSPWVIQWATNPEVTEGISVGIFQIYVYDVKNTSIPVSVAANTNSSEANNSYVYQTGTFYLMINAANTNWTVSVQEYK